MGDHGEALRTVVARAAENREPLEIRGGGSKAFLGRQPRGRVLETGIHSGVVRHDPAELVVTVRAGTTLEELEAALAEDGQMLGFEPPRFGPGATIGGTVACGLSGPRCPWSGAVRDALLGVRIVNGRGEVLRFGGEVMKNVAGFDLSRLMAGALGTLGLLLEVSLRVMPLPEREATLSFETREAGEAIRRMNEWVGQPLPLSAAAWEAGVLRVRLSGTDVGLEAARRKMGGERDEAGDTYWQALREQSLPFFPSPEEASLWRLSVPPSAAPLRLPGRSLLDWGGAQRWLVGDAPPEEIRSVAAEVGGHATLFRGGDRQGDLFHPLPAPLARLHRRLKQAFDPDGILNPGRLYREL